MEITNKVISNDCRLTKFLQKTADFHTIETGFFSLDENILCLSTQIGCAMGCVFCASACSKTTPTKSFVRDLSVEEIVSQAENALQSIRAEQRDKKILFSFMGMGEPFLNYKNIVESIHCLSVQYPQSRATISTIGISPKRIQSIALEKFEIPVKLHLSLHAPTDKLRRQLLPCAKKISSTLKALEFFATTTRTQPKLNYVLIKGLNDSPTHAETLAELCAGKPFIAKLSQLNPCAGFATSNQESFVLFEKILSSRGVPSVRFFSEGSEIVAGCGQLRNYFNKNQ